MQKCHWSISQNRPLTVTYSGMHPIKFDMLQYSSSFIHIFLLSCDQITEVINQAEMRYLESIIVGRKVLTKALRLYGDIKTLTGW